MVNRTPKVSFGSFHSKTSFMLVREEEGEAEEEEEDAEEEEEKEEVMVGPMCSCWKPTSAASAVCATASHPASRSAPTARAC
jgi:hypothetical protein